VNPTSFFEGKDQTSQGGKRDFAGELFQKWGIPTDSRLTEGSPARKEEIGIAEKKKKGIGPT